MTPFLVAATNGNNDVVKVMLEHFKDDDKIKLWAAEDENDRTAIHLIASKANRQMDPKVVDEWVDALRLIVADIKERQEKSGKGFMLKRVLNNRDETGHTEGLKM